MLELEIDQRDALGKVRDQGQHPTCLAHAISTVHRQIQEIDEPLSAETLHYHASGGDLSSGCTVESLQQALRKDGQPEYRHCKPIPDGTPDGWSPPTNVPVYRSESEQEPPLPMLVKHTIRASDLPVLGITLPEGFYDPVPPWVISAGSTRGVHAVAGIGLAQYNNETVVLIRNSWGRDWANSGHAWLDRSFLDTHLEAVLILTRGDNR